MESDGKLTDVLNFFVPRAGLPTLLETKECPASPAGHNSPKICVGGGAYIGFSQFTIQGMPNWSVNMAKARDQKVSASGMVIFPPALSSL